MSFPRFERFARDHRERLPEMFTADELARGDEGLAIAFAVKEAAMKSLGGLTGWELDWREIGSPAGRDGGAVVLGGSVAVHARKLGVGRVTVSVTRWGRYALASAIALGAPSPRRIRKRGHT